MKHLLKKLLNLFSDSDLEELPTSEEWPYCISGMFLQPNPDLQNEIIMFSGISELNPNVDHFANKDRNKNHSILFTNIGE
jgi:hypothetical protein